MVKLLLVDFDGVMSQDRFYASYPYDYANEFAYLQRVLFKENKDNLLDYWMRGRIGFQELHRRIAQEVNIDPKIFDTALAESVKRMELNRDMLATVQRARSVGIKVALFTDNMDIFDTVSVVHHKLADTFDAIYSSSQHGKLKVEDDSLFIKICKELSVVPQDVALVDDSRRSTEAVNSFGGRAFLYERYAESHPRFKTWLSAQVGVAF